jgi:hypothetical protein
MPNRHGLGRWVTGLLTAAIVTGLSLGATGCSAPTASSTMGYGGVSTGRATAASPAGLTAESAPAPSRDLGTGSGVDASAVPKDQRLVVKNKAMRIEVTGVSAAIDKLRAMASRDGADISAMQVASSTDQPIYRPMAEGDVASGSDAPLQAYVTIRVPALKYQAFIDEAAKIGRVLYQAENAEDVTQQHIDLKARLENLKAQEARLREFFAKAKSVTEMLQIENELTRVRGEIESMSAEVAYLERQAAMATVTIELAEPKALVRPGGTDWGVAAAFTESIRAFVSTLNVLIVMLGPILALAVFIVLPGALLARLVVRIVRARRAARPVAAPVTPDEPDRS